MAEQRVDAAHRIKGREGWRHGFWPSNFRAPSARGSFGGESEGFECFAEWPGFGAKISTITAPAMTTPRLMTKGALINDQVCSVSIVVSVLTTGAPPNTSGMTKIGLPPKLNAMITPSAPMAP